MEYDVIVVGAGPAGATTAAALAQKGHDVCLIDRTEFPRDKTCGDAVPAGAIEILDKLGMADLVSGAVERREFYPLTGMLLVSPRGYELEASFHKGLMGADSFVAPRVYFDDIIQKGAVRTGAQFLQATVKEPIVEDGFVTGVRAKVNGGVENIKAKMVVGADGVTSVITRALRAPENQHIDLHRAVALRAYIEDLQEIPHFVEFYMYKEILPGYAWIFPTGEGSANVGLGMRLDEFRKRNLNLKDLLQSFLDMPAIKKRLKNGGTLRNVATWQLNFGSQEKLQHAFNGALLVGDAAGFINPLTGGGIHNAMVSGMLAAKEIETALETGDVRREAMLGYETAVQEEMWQSMKRSYLYQRSFLRFPFLVDFLVRFLGAESSLAQTFLSKL